MEIEQRGKWIQLPAEVRADTDGIKVSGYAAVFNEETLIGGKMGFREVIKPGAFRNAIGRDDVSFLVNHDGLPLARTRSGTLRLEEDERGLRIETELDPADPDVAKLVPKMKRSDLDKMSFAFGVPPGGDEWDYDQDIALRTLTEVALFDVSVVDHPAYAGTEIGFRHVQRHREEMKQQNADGWRIRIRRKMDLGLRSRRA